jgi:hypothetical protein
MLTSTCVLLNATVAIGAKRPSHREDSELHFHSMEAGLATQILFLMLIRREELKQVRCKQQYRDPVSFSKRGHVWAIFSKGGH